ncbi:MAG: FMN-binding negative transcriptional regulator [Eudoraea sp.]|nr:FMN-binding negative transcriptional regulator [Eudoraea sp.]
MYIPPKYKNEDLVEVKDFLRSNSFAILINTLKGRPWATHTPLELDRDKDGNDILIGHIARANPQWGAFEANSEVLCIFNGPHSYVSSSWYKEEEVPTWNYIAVHIYGTLSVMSESEVLTWLHGLVDRYEKDEETPLSLKDMSPATLRQVKGVVGFRIKINKIEAAYKLSQGREEDHERIIHELKKKRDPGSQQVSNIMKNRGNKES